MIINATNFGFLIDLDDKLKCSTYVNVYIHISIIKCIEDVLEPSNILSKYF